MIVLHLVSNLNITSSQKLSSYTSKTILAVLDGLQIPCLRMQSGIETNTKTCEFDLPCPSQTILKKGSGLNPLHSECRGSFLPPLGWISETQVKAAAQSAHLSYCTEVI